MLAAYAGPKSQHCYAVHHDTNKKGDWLTISQLTTAVAVAVCAISVPYTRLNAITELFDSKPVPNVGTVLPLEDVRIAHEMLPPARIAAERSIEALKLPRVLLI